MNEHLKGKNGEKTNCGFYDTIELKLLNNDDHKTIKGHFSLKLIIYPCCVHCYYFPCIFVG